MPLFDYAGFDASGKKVSGHQHDIDRRICMNINTVTLTGNLTRDPELKVFGEATVCKLRLAVNERVKVSGEWTSRAMYFDVDVFGRSAEASAQYLAKGSHVAISGRLKWREWTTDAGDKRQAVSIVATEVEFPSKKEAQGDAFEQAKAFTEKAPPQQDFREQAHADTAATFDDTYVQGDSDNDNTGGRPPRGGDRSGRG